MTTKELQDYVWNWLRNKGLNENATAGIMGNISQECSWDVTLVEAGSGIGFGLCQWSFERRTKLEAYGTDLDHQLNFLWAELTGEIGETGASCEWINNNGYDYTTFYSGGYSVTESTSAFCWCWERPNVNYANLDFRQTEATNFFNTYKGTGGGTGGDTGSTEKVENAVKWLINIANDDTHGYDQNNRWSPDYDCSSFIISGFEQAGIALKTNGASSTHDLKEVCLKTGFKEVLWENDVTKLVRGDIILNESSHVCCYIGDGQIVQASINENGGTAGGQTGDQTGKEIYVRDFYTFSGGWDCVLRFGNGSAKKGEVYAKIEKTPYNVKQLTQEQITFLKTLSFNDIVKMKYTYNHNKKQVGQNYLGNKLTFDNKEYKIKDVRNDGYIILANSGNVCYKNVNPKYICYK